MSRAAEARSKIRTSGDDDTLERINRKVSRNEAVGEARSELIAEDSLGHRFAQLEKEDEINRILNELKARKGA